MDCEKRREQIIGNFEALTAFYMLGIVLCALKNYVCLPWSQNEVKNRILCSMVNDQFPDFESCFLQ